MRSFKAVCSLALMSIGIASADDECKYALEIVQLQDASDTLRDDVASMRSVSTDLFTQLNAAYPGVRYGLSSFTDKPIPLSGYGDYGAWAKAGFNMDYCYQNNMDFATSADELNAALDRVQIGSGADLGEAMLEAMIYAVQDKALSWSTEQYSADGRPIVKFIVQITDGYPHAEGDAAGNIGCWNTPRSYPNGPDGPSHGGYGASDLNTAWGVAYYINVPNPYTGYDYEPDWQKMSALLSKIDHDIQLTDDEIVSLKSLNETFGPAPMMEPVSPHPGAWDPLDCHHVEYPSPAITANVLVEHNVFPIILVADPGQMWDRTFQHACDPVGIDYYNNAQDCLMYMWQNTMTEMGITGVVAKLGASSTDIVQIMLDSIKDVVQEVCLQPTTAPTVAPTVPPTVPPTVAPTVPPTVPPTVSPTVAPTNAPTVSPTDVPTGSPTVPPTNAPTVSPTDVPTGSPTDVTSDAPTTKKATTKVTTAMTTKATTTKGTTATTAATTKGATTQAGDATTANIRGSTTTTTTTAPVVVPSGGSNTAVVAAAGAGAVAAVAAAGAFAYTKFGAGFMKKSVPQGLDAVQQVDIPESPLEREAMEEVTMDMFQ